MVSVRRTAWALLQEHRPRPTEALRVSGWRPAAPLPVGAPFDILSWNLQYCGSRQHHFFYDGGAACHVPPADEQRTRAGIAAVLAQHRPALCLLQEIDRGADRTGGVDQLPALVEGAGAACAVTATYHQSAYVPTPPHEPMGRVDLHLGVLSHAPIRGAERHQLALKQTSRLVQAFDLKRCLLTGEVALADGRALHVGLTHLSAFSRGDGTLDRQVDSLEAWMSSRPEGTPWVLAGDFNMLPPGDDPTRLSAEGDLYTDAVNPMERLLPRFREVFGAAHQRDVAARTYLPFGASQPDRKIDYVFVGGPVEVLGARVLPELDLSDHLPVLARVRVTG